MGEGGYGGGQLGTDGGDEGQGQGERRKLWEDANVEGGEGVAAEDNRRRGRDEMSDDSKTRGSEADLGEEIGTREQRKRSAVGGGTELPDPSWLLEASIAIFDGFRIGGSEGAAAPSTSSAGANTSSISSSSSSSANSLLLSAPPSSSPSPLEAFFSLPAAREGGFYESCRISLADDLSRKARMDMAVFQRRRSKLQ